MKYHFKIHKEGKGYWAECLELKGCLTQGENRDDLRKNCEEALNLYLAEPETSNMIFPMPKKIKKSKNTMTIDVEPTIALAMLVRQTRLKQGRTQQELAKALQIHLSAYQKYEDHTTSNLGIKTIQKLRKVLPELKVSLIFD